MICYMFFVSKSHSATLFYPNVCATSLRSFPFFTFIFYRCLTSPRSCLQMTPPQKNITNDCPPKLRSQMSANTTTSARSDIYRVFVGCLQRPRRGRIVFFAMRFYTEHIGCAVACLFCSDFFVYIFSFDFYKSRCNCYIADSIFTYVLYVCKTFSKKMKNIFNYANRLRTTLFILRRNFLYNI